MRFLVILLFDGESSIQILSLIFLHFLLYEILSQIIIVHRLGLPCARTGPCAYGNAPDSADDHALSCSSFGGRSWRQAAVNSVLLHAFRRFRSAPTLEPGGLLSGDGRRLDGVADAPWMLRRLA